MCAFPLTKSERHVRSVKSGNIIDINESVGGRRSGEANQKRIKPEEDAIRKFYGPRREIYFMIFAMCQSPVREAKPMML